MQQNLVNIKGTPKYLAIHLATEHDFKDLVEALKVHLADSKGFFSGARFKFQESPTTLSKEQHRQLELICRHHGLLPCLDEPTNQPEYKEPMLTTKGFTKKELNKQGYFISKNLRNGDKLTFDGDVTLLGDINPGAKLATTGNIIVMGYVKGIVHAGIAGNKDSFIMASTLNPQQIRIGPYLALRPDAKKKSITFNPEIARVEDDRIVISRYP